MFDKILKTETLDSTYYIIVLRYYDETVKDSKLIDTSNAVYKVCAEKGVVALFPYQSEDSVKRWIASTAAGLPALLQQQARRLPTAPARNL